MYYLYLVESLESYKIYLFVNVYQSPVLQGMINGLIEIGRCCGMEMNVGEKTEVMSISSLSSQVQIMVDNKKKTWRLWIISTECVA